MDQSKWGFTDEYPVRRPNPILPVIAEILAPVQIPASLSDHIAAVAER
jgi:hypothetical protein